MADETAGFRELTGAAPEAAKFFLDAANGDLEMAVDQYFASGGQMPQQATASTRPAGASVNRAPVPAAPAAAAAVPAVSGASGYAGSGASRPNPKPASWPGNIRSLADMSSNQEDSDDEEGNELYTGGAKSGQVVKGAPGTKDHRGRIDNLFDAARAAGAADGSEVDLRQPGMPGTGAFSGRARTLAGGEAPATPAAPVAESNYPQTVTHVITFYASGVFTVDDGEPRQIMDPSNRDFMESIQRGECPQELEPEDRRTHVNVNLLRKEEEYTPPAKPRYKAFAGKGQTLAGPSASTSAAASGSATSANPATAITTAWEGVNESQPATSIQLRLADGQRLVARLNLTHTVGDIRRFIAAARPGGPADYQLVTSFPTKPLTDDKQTVKEAGLENAVVMQKV